MKDLIDQIKDIGANKFSKKYLIEKDQTDEQGKLQLGNLFLLLEQSLSEPKKYLESIAPNYKKDVLNLDFQKLNDCLLGETLEVELRFYGIDKKSIQLKAFARSISAKGKVKKIAKATYTYKAVYLEPKAA